MGRAWMVVAGLAVAVWLGGGPAAAEAASPDPVAFGVAVENGNRRQVEKWLDEGMPPDFVADRIGTGLMIAAWNGDIEMMELFVARGANPRRANRNGEQALQLAAWNGHAAAVRWLLEHGAVLNRDDKHWSALHYAVFNGHLDLARELIARGAELDARSPNGSTPLMMAAREGHEELARLLLEAGADTKLQSDWGDTALTFAMRYDHYRLGKMISTPEEFEIAVKAPKEAHGEPSRSLVAPSRITDILRQMREAEAAGGDVGNLREQLHSAIAEFRGAPKPQALAGPKVIRAQRPPRALVITAKRAQPKAGERVEVVAADASAAPAVTPSRIADLVRRIRVAEAQGQASDALRRELDEAMAKLK